jgi:hypothetical protein
MKADPSTPALFSIHVLMKVDDVGHKRRWCPSSERKRTRPWSNRRQHGNKPTFSRESEPTDGARKWAYRLDIVRASVNENLESSNVYLRVQNPSTVTVRFGRCSLWRSQQSTRDRRSVSDEQLAHLLGDSSKNNLRLDKHNKKWTTTMRGIGGRSRSAAPSERYADAACCESSSNGTLLANASVRCVVVPVRAHSLSALRLPSYISCQLNAFFNFIQLCVG